MDKLFDIMIDDKLYPVFNIDNKEHDIGRWNGSPETWWLLYEDLNSEPKLLNEFNEDLNWIPYIDRGIHRICWEINYKQYNKTRYKYHSYDISNGGVCIMKANGREVYKFHSSDLMHAMSNVSVIVGKLICHPYNFFEPEKDDGRKIFFCGLPAFVYKGCDVGEISIKPDYSKISKKSWWEKYDFYNFNQTTWNDEYHYEYELDESDKKEDIDDFSKNDLRDIINWGDALSDGKIWWFRK